jgi:hypothetical protein
MIQDVLRRPPGPGSFTAATARLRLVVEPEPADAGQTPARCLGHSVEPYATRLQTPDLCHVDRDAGAAQRLSRPQSSARTGFGSFRNPPAFLPGECRWDLARGTAVRPAWVEARICNTSPANTATGQLVEAPQRGVPARPGKLIQTPEHNLIESAFTRVFEQPLKLRAISVLAAGPVDVLSLD